MAAERLDRNEGPGGTRDSQFAGANSGFARDQLWRQRFPTLAGIHAWRRDEISRQSGAGRILSAPGTPKISRLAYAAAEGGRRTRLRNIGSHAPPSIRRRRVRRPDAMK